MNSNNSIDSAREYLAGMEVVRKLDEDNDSYENIFLVKNKNEKRVDVQKICKDTYHFNILELYVHQIMQDNSHFVKLHDIVHIPGRTTYWTMDYIEDGDLFDIIKFGRYKIDEKKCRKIIFQLVNALNDLHSHQIIHNDVKLENLLYNKKKNKVIICDYGLCHIIGTPSMDDGTVVYFSPEKIKGELNQVSFDWWAVGVVTYEILSGKYPYKLKNGSGDYDSDHADYNDLNPEDMLKYLSKRPPKIGQASDSANDFVQQMLRYDTTKRLSSYNNIIRHPFLKF
ncbi:pk [Spodoptera litura granulovirus]|uniref:Pk n=1 Tax=Spodoptera litura granulovirus TaxID=359919 RepID=A5IZK5_9BBAC|nr:pk [Spodoptera litura granulovirus]ABQ51946.1 pk [Spodoptera litura granulovirus]